MVRSLIAREVQEIKTRLVKSTKGRRRVTASVKGRSESGEQEGQLIKWLFPFSVAPSRFGKRDGH